MNLHKSNEIVSAATNLEELKEILEQNELHDKTWEELPTFGGEMPFNTGGVWSWDESRVLVGTNSEDLEIMDRDDEDAWWN